MCGWCKQNFVTYYVITSSEQLSRVGDISRPGPGYYNLVWILVNGLNIYTYPQILISPGGVGISIHTIYKFLNIHMLCPGAERGLL